MANFGSSYSPVWTAGVTTAPISGDTRSPRYIGGVGVQSGNRAAEDAWGSALSVPSMPGLPRTVAVSPAPALPAHQLSYNRPAQSMQIGGSADTVPSAPVPPRNVKDFEGFRQDFIRHTQGLDFSGASDRASSAGDDFLPQTSALPAPSAPLYQAPSAPNADAAYFAGPTSAPTGLQPTRSVSRTAAPIIGVFDDPYGADAAAPASSGGNWWNRAQMPARTPEQFMTAFSNHLGAVDGYGQRASSGMFGQVVMDIPQQA